MYFTFKRESNLSFDISNYHKLSGFHSFNVKTNEIVPTILKRRLIQKHMIF